MPKRRLILAILAFGIAAALTHLLTRPREPSYNGRTLSRWMEIYDLGDRNSGISPEEAKAAIQQIGTNAIPLLAKWAQYEPSAPTRAAEYVLRVLRIGWAPVNEPFRRAWGAVWAIAELARDHDLESFPAIQKLADNPKPGPLTEMRVQRLREILSNQQPPPRLYYRLTKIAPEALTNAPPPTGH